MQTLRCLLLFVLGSLPNIGHAKTPILRHAEPAGGSGPTPSEISVPDLGNSKPVITASAAENLGLGQKLEQLGDLDDAVSFYRRSLDSPDPKVQAMAIEAIAALLRKQQLQKEADDPKRGYLDLGRLWRDHGKTDDAIAAYEKALEANSVAIRKDAANELAEQIRMKTTWWRQYATNPVFAFFTSKPIVLIVFAVLVAVIVRACLRRTDLLLIPNPSVPDTQWLPILIHDYQRQFAQSHIFAPQRSVLPLVLFGHAAELFADLLSRVTRVDSGTWRQSFIKFFGKPRFELYLSLPPSGQGGIVTAALRRAGEVTDCFIKEFSINDVTTIQRDLAFWVAYHIGQRE